MGSESLALFCKSYAGDLVRFERLWLSVTRHNRERISFYASVPASELEIFKAKIGNPPGLNWLTDEKIVAASPRANLDNYSTWDGRKSQQVVKSEFWRAVDCDAYLCIDSESEFLRDFDVADFVHPSGTPYTVMHQNKELLQIAADKGISKVLRESAEEADRGRAIFGREGPDYAFGPTPVIWARAVWRDLDEKYLAPRGWTLWDAIETFPSELHWYGEALLHFRSIPLIPIGPLFRVYHYNWQWHTMRRLGETTETIKANYLGMLRQSNWDYTRDSGLGIRRKPLPSRLLRAVKHFLARFR
jgi:hypothetical protein